MDINGAIRKECEMRRYSERTIKTYQECVRRFFNFCDKKQKEVTKKDVREFLEQISNRASGGTIHVYLNSLKFFFEDVLRRKMQINIKYSRRPARLPLVLTKEETKKLIEAIKNPKHKLMIEFMYSVGLRVSEVINMRILDLQIERGFGFVRCGKGKKDRIFIIADCLKDNLRELIAAEKLNNNDYLFLTNKHERYSARTLAEITKSACKIAGIDKKVHCHTLRHSFATHLIENSCSLSEVQALLGHKSPETTMIYTHIATPNMIKVKSPIDFLYSTA